MIQPTTSPDEALIGLLQGRGYVRVEPPLLQPAGLFLDLSGEDIRRRLYLTQGPDGTELCLRPEYTIPVSLDHLREGGGPAEYCYAGPVFRHRPGESGEFQQAGLESIGRSDIEAADADVLATALAGLAVFPPRDLEIRIGDMGLFDAVAAALDVPAALRRRLVLALAAGRPLDTALNAPDQRAGRSDYGGLLAAIEGQDPGGARAFVEDVISIAGIARVGGRSAAEIADRFLSKASQRSGPITDEARRVLRRYLAIAAPLDRAIVAVMDLVREAELPVAPAIERFRRRADEIARRGIDLSRLFFAAEFARNLDYYTGFVFEIRDAAWPDGRFLVAGGRYDRLLHRLGATGPEMPAVGCAFWPDRLAGSP